MRIKRRSFLSLLMGAAASTLAGKGDVTFLVKYEGGSLDLNQHDSLKVALAQDRVILLQGQKRHEISTASINEISYGNDVHRRVGTAIGVGLVTGGIGLLVALVKTKKHYVGVTWNNTAPEVQAGSRGGGIFQVGKGEYRGFIAAIEGFTGLKAVNADAAVSGGTSPSLSQTQKCTAGQAVYVVAVESTSRDLALTRANLEIERKAKEQFAKEKRFRVASNLRQADFVFLVMLDPESSRTDEIALAVTREDFAEHKDNLDALRNAAIWQSSGRSPRFATRWSSVSKDLVKKFHREMSN